MRDDAPVSTIDIAGELDRHVPARLRGLPFISRLEELLGADGLRLLRRGSGVAPPRTAAVSAVLSQLEALEREDALASRATAADPVAPSVPSHPSAPSIQEPPHAR